MNKDLAIKISKHPLIKRLLESTNQKEVARLIVEELMNEEFVLDNVLKFIKDQDPDDTNSSISEYFRNALKEISSVDEWDKLRDAWDFLFDNKEGRGFDLKSRVRDYEKGEDRYWHDFQPESYDGDVLAAAGNTNKTPSTSDFFIQQAFRSAKLMVKRGMEIDNAVEQEEEEQKPQEKKPQQSEQDPDEYIENLERKIIEKLDTLGKQFRQHDFLQFRDDVGEEEVEIDEAVKKYSDHYVEITKEVKKTKEGLEKLVKNPPRFLKGEYRQTFIDNLEPYVEEFDKIIEVMRKDAKEVVEFARSHKQDMEANIDKDKEELENKKAELEAARKKLEELPPETSKEDVEAIAKDEIDKVIPKASKEKKERIISKVVDAVTSPEEPPAEKTPEEEPPEEKTPEQIFKTEFTKDEQRVLTAFRDYVREKEPIEEADNPKGIGAALGIKSETIREFMKQAGEDLVHLRTSFAKVMKNQELLKGINWLFDQDQPTPTGKEPKTDRKSKSSPESEKLEVDPKTAEEYIKAVEELQNDFYRKRYKIQQAEIIRSVIDAIAKIAGEEELELSYKPVPKEKPEGEGEALQEGKEITADDKEIKDLRIAFRSFLSLVNKTKKALAKFEDEAKRGTVLARSSKKDFMNLLKRLQDTIAKLVASIKQILDTPEEQLQEVTKEEMLNRWKEVQEAYDKTIEANSALKELLKGEGEGASDDVVNLAYSTALNLSQYFPSVNPFNKGAQSKADLTRYKDTFQSAIDDVKESLQYVVNIATRGIVNASSLYESSEALQEFSEKIKDIFGVEGPISGDYNPKSEPAAEGKPKPEETEIVTVEWDPDKNFH